LAKHPEGPRLRRLIEPRVRAADIARAGGFSRAFVSQVLAGDAKPSPKFIEACLELGLPVDVLFDLSPESAKPSRDQLTDGQGTAQP
jgi:transcriptional regulator with XRE-family HTH domain